MDENARILAQWLKGVVQGTRDNQNWPFAAFQFTEYSDPSGFAIQFITGHRYWFHVGELVPASQPAAGATTTGAGEE